MNTGRITDRHLLNLALALAGGLAMCLAFGLHPVWWLAWVAPTPLLLAALRSKPRAAFVLGWFGSLVASSALLPFFLLLAPAPLAVWLLALFSLPLALAVWLARRVAGRTDSAWGLLAFPVLMTAFDTLLAHFNPDGNWGSIAHSQAGFPPAVQVLSLAGVPGLVFLMALVPAVLAFAMRRGWRTVRVPAACAAVLVAGSFAFGALRLPSGSVPEGDAVGIAVIDEGIWPGMPASEAERVWAQYERHVATLAGQGARVVVLPEKVAVLGPGDVERATRRLSLLAARTHVALVAGVGTFDDRGKRNLAWLFTPDGRLDASYQKHHMAPPERDTAPGADYDVRGIAGTRYGLAICKDMHFATMGLAYGARQAAAMLVPAWDFGADGEYEARMSALRGVENGFAMVRGARSGLLTVTDAYGRIVAEAPSAPLPGARLLARLPSSPPLATLYGRTGDAFGWLCVAGALGFVFLAFAPQAWRKRGRRRGPGPRVRRPAL